MNRIDVLGVGIDDLTREEAVERALRLIGEHRSAYMVTPNPEIVMAAWDSDEVRRAIENADLVIPDGTGVIMAARILGTPLRERMPGIDVAGDIMKRLSQSGGTVYLLGARPGVAEKAAENITTLYPGLTVCGYRDGYGTDEAETVDSINAAGPDFVLVCLGASRQELWMARNAPKLRVGLMAGLGGTLDVLSGEVKRAPESWQRLQLEWLYRCLIEPKRFKKTLKFPHFILKALRERAGKESNGKG